MKKYIILIIIFMFISHAWGAHGGETSKFDFGGKFYAGGRYDDMRMCVASDPGVKGGPAADIMLLLRYHLSKTNSLVFSLPVMRPVLFGAAFEMLQFEPEVTFNFGFELSEKTMFLLGPSLGVSLHYGPDYNSDSEENRGESFFAAGPHVSMLFGMNYSISESYDLVYGIRLFHTSLFSENGDYGLVLGAAAEIGIYFRF